ncbi:VWA domain-containing protein [Tenacibaculum sp. TC6]|uniref:VWA domain-containing protein n=1 Tax=Tenacibaculum sp. TC6 TaxID=3423223 RepID=UPI003D363BAA
MQTLTLVYIILVLLLSIVIAFFQYFFKEKKQPKITVLLFALKTLSLFLIGLLLINPKIDIVQTENVKPTLALLVDNSLSTRYFKEEKDVTAIYTALKNNEQLNSKFSIQPFSFGNAIQIADSLTFNEGETDIYKAITSVNELYGKEKLATLLITDGNQTTGNDYEFVTSKHKIYPVIIGDTTQYQDLQITQLNVNKYSYIKNKFPVEALLLYEGKEEVTATFTLTHKGKKVYSESLKFSPENPAKTVTVNLTSEEKGVQYYQASISKLTNEKNTANNYKSFSVEVIDEQTKVLLLSSVMHPDLGAIKKAIESNKQRSVDIQIVGKKRIALDEYQMYIFYQPNFYFREYFKQVNSNLLIVTGTKTDWHYLNSLELGVKKNVINQTENAGAVYNENFLTFLQEDIGFNDFPPLEDKFGKLQVNSEAQVLLYQQISGIATEQPLITTIEKNEQKHLFIMGEGIWKWRAASYLKDQTFENFDTFIGNITQYLASNQKRNRLEVKAKNIYPANAPITFSAFYVDKNYRFDNRASLELKIMNVATKEVKTVPFSLVNNSYQVAVEGLASGEYAYQVSVAGQTVKQYGRFQITTYQIEEQFTNANKQKLQKLANKTKGHLYTKNQVENIVADLMNDPSYFTVQKSVTSQKNLIDWKWILILIAVFLSVEWFIRKYYGKI